MAGGFFDGLLNATQSPLFLGGANLLMGAGPSGMMDGMKTGAGFQEMQRKRQMEEAQKGALGPLLGQMGMGQEDQAYVMANPEVAANILQSVYQNRFDPMADLKKRTAEANLAQTQSENGMFDLKRRLMQAQIAESGARVDQGRNGKYGLQPVYGTDENGNPIIMQIGPSGEAVKTRLPDGARLDLAAKAREQAYGKERGETLAQGQIDLPRQLDNAALALRTISTIKEHPGKKWGLGTTAGTSYIPNTDARGFANLVDQAKGQVFLEAFNSLRGGGAITEAEGMKATQALSRLDRYQSPSDFDLALKDLEDVIRSGADRARRKAGQHSQPVPSPTTDLKSKYGLE